MVLYHKACYYHAAYTEIGIHTTYSYLVERIHCTFGVNCEYHTKLQWKVPITITPFFPRREAEKCVCEYSTQGQTQDNGYELGIEKKHVACCMNNEQCKLSVECTLYTHRVHKWNEKRVWETNATSLSILNTTKDKYRAHVRMILNFNRRLNRPY